MTDGQRCQHPIFRYLGADRWFEGGEYEQRHRCIDCAHEERGVPSGSVMVGHAPGECSECDRYALELPADQRERWIRLNEEQRT